MIFSSSDIARGFVVQFDKFGAKQATKELAALLHEQRIHSKTDDILAEIEKEYAKVHGIIEAQVRTAFPLSESLKKELAERVKSATNAKKVILQEEIDQSLLGGVIINAPDMELDLSLKAKLAKLKA